VTYGLPTPSQEPTIMAKVQSSSALIDQYCGRTDVNGNGSLVWTTYTERISLPEGRNIQRVAYRPLVGIPLSTFNAYAASAASGIQAAQTLLASGNTMTAADGVTLSPFITISGRYGYGRRGQQQVYPDLNYGANILQIASYFGGPPNFTPIAVTNTDFNPINGEFWVPAGLYLSSYTEIQMTYNSGFPPNQLPPAVKQACALLVQNYLSRPASNLTSFGVGSVHHTFSLDLIDVSIQHLIDPFKTVIAR
ncbi:MAG: hypothetical protein KGI50_07545, partial [Patescibacteria group bacterium]|nr:hypothetical protein [Patescibacteria group bacterium]